MGILNIYYINKTIQTLEDYNKLNNQSNTELRKKTDILIIDDEDLTHTIDYLRDNNFCVQQKNDIDNIKDLNSYKIVFCDINGVGKKLGSNYEGAYIIKEAKIAYPNKQIIAYSSATYNAKFNDYLSYADNIIFKGTDVDDWVSIINSEIEKLVDPKEQWRHIQKALLNNNIPTIKIAEIESKYVKSIETKNFTSLENLIKNTNSNDCIKNIILQFLSSAIVELLRM